MMTEKIGAKEGKYFHPLLMKNEKKTGKSVSCTFVRETDDARRIIGIGSAVFCSAA